jgi:N-acetyl-beta-hexosaminidase
MSITNNGLYYGTITDWPKISERMMTIDMSGRKYPINFFDDLIKQMSWDKMNTFQ